MNKQEQLKLALNNMKGLNIYSPYIDGLKRNVKTLFEGYGGFWIQEDNGDDKLELIQKINEIEKEYNCVVYAVTHEYSSFGELYDFLTVFNEQDQIEKTNNGKACAYAYVWNKSIPEYSEFGYITLQSLGGGIARVA